MIRLFGHFFDIPAILLALFELGAMFFLVIIINSALEIQGFSVSHDSKALTATVVTLLSGGGMVAVGLYNRENFLHWEDSLSRALVILPLLVVMMIAVLAFYDSFVAEVHRRGNYLLCAISLTAFFPVLIAFRRLLLVLIERTNLFTRRVLVIGSGGRAAKIDRLCRKHQDRSFAIVGYVRLGQSRESTVGAVERRQQRQRRDDFWVKGEDLQQFCHEKEIDELVVASTERRGLPVLDLLACKLAGIQITEYASFWERETGEIDLDEISPSWMIFSNGFHIGRARSFAKRFTDIMISSTLLLLTLPITLVTAILIKLESPGPLFYRQERVGRHGKVFTILKFRSMRADAEKDGPRWAAKNDSRVTRVGAFIRKVRIDELPQVINVLKGEMSMVGPRPERPIFVAELAKIITYYNERHVAKPGITGWAQINYPYGATEEDARRKLSYDLYYVKNGNLFLDFVIIIQTLKVLLWNSGAR